MLCLQHETFRELTSVSKWSLDHASHNSWTFVHSKSADKNGLLLITTAGTESFGFACITSFISRKLR